MRRKIACTAFTAIALTTGLSACSDQAGSGGAGSRDQIKIVGSSTVYPFSTLVAEQYVNANPGMKAPVVESNGTGAGMKQFCAGVGARHPDIENASRRMTAAEYMMCEENGVDRIMEIQVGVDGIAFAEALNGPKLALTPPDLYLALAANPRGAPNKAKTWKDVNPTLPAIPIQVYGPPATSGTRDAMAELILARGCEAVYPASLDLKKKDENAYNKACQEVRTDGPYVDAGENDNLIVQKLQSNPNAIGVFGFSYLEENKATLAGVTLSGIAPSYETIAGGTYPGSRPLYLYVKQAHMSAIPGLQKYIEAYSKAWNPGGPLAKRGLIAAPANVRQASSDIIENGTLMNPARLK